MNTSDVSPSRFNAARLCFSLRMRSNAKRVFFQGKLTSDAYFWPRKREPFVHQIHHIQRRRPKSAGSRPQLIANKIMARNASCDQYAGGAWNGAGIISGAAASNGNSCGPGYADSAAPGNLADWRLVKSKSSTPSATPTWMAL
jgi:hypothetical protein